LANFTQFYPHFMNLNHVLKKVGRPILNLIFPESTCSGASKNSNLVKVRELLGQLVPQHDVYSYELEVVKEDIILTLLL
jgi:hypothetical protein